MEVPVFIKPHVPDLEPPHYKRPGDAGIDLIGREDKILEPGKQHLFKIGFSMKLPEGTVGIVCDRSGLAAKHGITTLAGVIDHTYRGEMGVVLMNASQTPYEVKKGDRIAQLLILPVITGEIKIVEEIDDTELDESLKSRGVGGFGSSGR